MPPTSTADTPIRVPAGLEGVILCETRVSHVDGSAGAYRYRDYDAVELARKRGLEEVWHLLLYGELPDAAAHAEFLQRIATLRELPESLIDLLGSVARLGNPDRDLMLALRSACSLLSEHLGLEPILDLDPDVVREQTLQICSMLPSLAAVLYRAAQGQPIIEPDPDLGVAANYLYMLHGQRPASKHARVLERYMMLAADHGMGAGTLAARVVTSTGADLGSAAVAAIGALSGPLHGGAPHRALQMLEDIGNDERIDRCLAQTLRQGDRVMGFGHRVYRAPDPRAIFLRELAQQLGGERIALAEQVEARAATLLHQRKPDRALQVNVEFYAAVVMEQLRIPDNLLSSTFAIARMPGWSAHILEQISDNRLIRPLTEFAGGPLLAVPEAA